MRNLCLIISATLALAGGSGRADVRIEGAGSTFVAPMMQRWAAEYQKAHPEIKIDYQAIGSGGGINGFVDRTIDFGASDAPLSKKDLKHAGGADDVIEFPIIAGGVVPAYNLPGGIHDLKFDGEVLAEIYLGKITRWNDAKMAELNPGVNLPDLAITPVWRTDGSGTTYIFTNYLAGEDPEFKSNIGAGKQVQWPVGTGGKGSDGVAAAVQQTTGGIGYVEQSYADQNQIAYGLVRNRAGNFVAASPDSISAATNDATNKMSGNLLTGNAWDQSGLHAYPIAGFTYVFIYKDLHNLKTQRQAAALANFLDWASHDGQNLAPEMHYASLAQKLQRQIHDALSEATFQSEPLQLK